MNELQIASKNIQVTPYGIEFVNDPTVEEIQSALKAVMKVDTMLQFYIGDLINRATWQWGEKYDKWEVATGYSNITLRFFSQISARFPAEFRESVFEGIVNDSKLNTVSFEHFKLVRPLSDEKALYFLKMVRDGKWTVAKLEEEIKRSKNGGFSPEPKTNTPLELPDGFVSLKEANIDVAGIVPVPKDISNKKSVVTLAVAMTDWEAKLVLDLIGDNPRLTMLADRIERTFGG